MTKINETVLLKAISSPNTHTTIQPSRAPRSTSAKAALRHCCAAWQLSFDAYLENNKRTSASEIFAAHHAGPAYRNAMPLLADLEGVRNFVACAAHGILVGAISPQMSGQLLYAAQLALAAHQCQPPSARPAATPTPSPRKSPLLELPIPEQTK